MRTLATSLILTATILSFASVAQVPVSNNARIFFVGNSYTGTSGSLHEYVKRAFAAATPSLTIYTEESISWARDVDYMWDSSGAPARIRTGNWDVVVLQGFWSGIDYPAGTLAMLQRTAARFDSLASAHGAQLVLFMPWTGNPLASWMSAGKFHTDMTAFTTNYNALGVTLGCPVAPCARIWHSLTDTLPRAGLARDYLYGDDLHQNNLSSYLNSWIFYAVLTGRTPVGLDYTYTTVSNVTYDAALRTAMQQRVWSIIQNEYSGVVFARPSGVHARPPVTEQSVNSTWDLLGRDVRSAPGTSGVTVRSGVMRVLHSDDVH